MFNKISNRFHNVCTNYNDNLHMYIPTTRLKKDPAQRFTAAQSLEHTWIRDKAPKATEFNLSNNIMSNLRGFMSGNKLKRAALHVSYILDSDNSMCKWSYA